MCHGVDGVWLFGRRLAVLGKTEAAPQRLGREGVPASLSDGGMKRVVEVLRAPIGVTPIALEGYTSMLSIWHPAGSQPGMGQFSPHPPPPPLSAVSSNRGSPVRIWTPGSPYVCALCRGMRGRGSSL